MKMLLKIFIVALFMSFLSGCIELCRPIYQPSQYLDFQLMSDMPIKLEVVDTRSDTEKFFCKIGWVNCWEKSSSKYKKGQYFQLDRSSIDVCKDAMKKAMERRGYVISEDANVIFVIEIKKYLCIITGSQNNTADIEIDSSVHSNNRVIFRKYFTKHTEKSFESFRQAQDAELLLSQCLSMVVEEVASNENLLSAVEKSYGKYQNSKTGEPPANAEIIPEKRTGTGFAISGNGLIATACHVINGAKKVKVYTSKDSSVAAIILKSDPINDLAVLKIENATSNFIQIAPMRSVKMGDKVFTVGFPVSSVLGHEAKYTEGVISSITGIKDAPSLMQITVPVQPGNSGGPLVNEKGEVVGVITSSAAVLPFIKESGTLPQNINWAVKVDYLMPLVELPKTEEKQIGKEDVITHVNKATFLIETE